MTFAKRFLHSFAEIIVFVLNCFDRVIFKGYLPFGGEEHLNAWVDRGLKMRRKDFLPFLQQHSEALVEYAKALAAQAERPYEYRQGKFKKEKFIQKLIRDERLTDGLVAVLCVQETCRTVCLKYGKRRPRLAFKRRPQRVLYYYHLDPEFGLMHVRLETWFPYTIQVYVNGHDWLARQMLKRKLGFVQQDNAFTQLDDPAKAQQLADRFAGLNWVKQLTKWARQVNPHVRKDGWLANTTYYWVTAQAEYATDILFASRSKLRELFPRLLAHAAVNFSGPTLRRLQPGAAPRRETVPGGALRRASPPRLSQRRHPRSAVGTSQKSPRTPTPRQRRHPVAEVPARPRPPGQNPPHPPLARHRPRSTTAGNNDPIALSRPANGSLKNTRARRADVTK